MSGAKYLIFPGLLFASMWVMFAVISEVNAWAIIAGALVIEAVSWLGEKE